MDPMLLFLVLVNKIDNWIVWLLHFSFILETWWSDQSLNQKINKMQFHAELGRKMTNLLHINF